MKENFVDLVSLFDIYGNLLTKNERESFELYYCDDLSLAEIAENIGITRQGARDNIVRAEKALIEYDEKLHLKDNYEKVRLLINEAIRKANDGKIDETIEILKEIDL